jgi:hypothetical protein
MSIRFSCISLTVPTLSRTIIIEHQHKCGYREQERRSSSTRSDHTLHPGSSLTFPGPSTCMRTASTDTAIQAPTEVPHHRQKLLYAVKPARPPYPSQRTEAQLGRKRTSSGKQKNMHNIDSIPKPTLTEAAARFCVFFTSQGTAAIFALPMIRSLTDRGGAGKVLDVLSDMMPPRPPSALQY